MQIFVTLDAQASHLKKTTALKVSATDTFAQVMHELAPKSGASRIADISLTEKEDLVEEDQPKDPSEDESAGSEAVEPIQINVKQVVDAPRDGAGSAIAKSNTHASIPPAFVAHGWTAAPPDQLVLQPATAPAAGDILPTSIAEKRGPQEMPSHIGTVGSLGEIVDPLAREVNKSGQSVVSQGQPLASAVLQSAGVNTTEISSQVGTLNGVEGAAVKAKLEPPFPRESAVSHLPNIETEMPQSKSTLVPQMNNHTLEVSNLVLQSEIELEGSGDRDFAPMGGGERNGIISFGVSDAKVASQAQVATAVAQQLAVAVQKNSGGATELVLNTTEIGRVSLSMTTHDGVLSMTITTERPETLDLMRRHIETLAQEFRELGFDDVSFSFHEQGQNDQQEGAQRQDINIAMSDAEPIPSAGQNVRTGNLDLRL
ncbi:flagellar hook-length control protein FliK [Yoonia sp. MH D7]